MNEQYDFLYPSDYHEDEITRAPWYPTDDQIKAAALNQQIQDRYERKMRNGLDNGNAVLQFDSEEARDANDLTHAKPMLVDRDSVADKELLLDTETGMRPVQLIDPLTGEKKIGYTEFQIPGYQEVVIDGIATGSYKDADGNPTKNEKGELYKYPDTRRIYEEDKEYFDSLPAEDRAQLLSYLRNKEAIANGVTSFIDEEAPQVYKDYLNRLTSQAYEPIDNFAWLAGPLSTPYYGLRTGLDAARGEWGDALENGVFTALPWASKVGGALVKNADPFVKEVVGLNAIGAPVTAYNAYNYGPEGGLTTAAMFTAMPMLGEAIKAADMPGVAKSLATLVQDAGERGVEGYKALSRQLSTIYKNVSPEIKKQIQDAIDFCNVAMESHDNFDFMNPGGMRPSPSMVKVRTVDGRTIEIPAETANKYLNEDRGSIFVNPKESITQNGFMDKTKEWAGKIGDAYNEVKERLGDAANALRGRRSEVESGAESSIESGVKPVESTAEHKVEPEIKSGTEGQAGSGEGVTPEPEQTAEVTDGSGTGQQVSDNLTAEQKFKKLLSERKKEALKDLDEDIDIRTQKVKFSKLKEKDDLFKTFFEYVKQWQFPEEKDGVLSPLNPKSQQTGRAYNATAKHIDYSQLNEFVDEVFGNLKIDQKQRFKNEFLDWCKKQDNLFDSKSPYKEYADKARKYMVENFKAKKKKNGDAEELLDKDTSFDKNDTLYDLLFPEYSNNSELKKAFRKSRDYAYRIDYHNKYNSGDGFVYGKQVGNGIDLLTNLGATWYAASNYDDEHPLLSSLAIGGSTVLPAVLRRAAWRAAGGRSLIGEQLNKLGRRWELNPSFGNVGPGGHIRQYGKYYFGVPASVGLVGFGGIQNGLYNQSVNPELDFSEAISTTSPQNKAHKEEGPLIQDGDSLTQSDINVLNNIEVKNK